MVNNSYFDVDSIGAARTAPRRLTLWRTLACTIVLLASATAASASDQMYFPAVDNVTNVIVNLINAETVRIDISAWYLTEHSISIALVNRFLAGVPVRVIGDRGAIFEIDPNTKKEFYYLANYGVPIRLRYNPTWYPEIDHWKTGIFKGQGIVEFGSANWTPFQLAPTSSTNFDDETAMVTSDPTLVGAFLTKFDTIWNDTTTEPESVISGPPYLKNWYDACALEANCSDFSTVDPSPAPMTINTARLEPDNPMPADLIWGQGPDFNNRLVTEINNESTAINFVIYRLTVDNITSALLSKHSAGVPIQLIIEPNEYLNRKWPEFWLTHANLDKLWAAGIPIKQRVHQGLTHMKMLVTSSYATNASSNFAAHWQRDQDYFVSAGTKPAIYSAMKNRFGIMWGDTTNFGPFTPQPADAATLVSPTSGSTGVSTSPALTWDRAAFATSYDVYVGTSQGSLSKVGNVAAQLTDNPPATYSFTPSSLATGTTYYWQVASRTFATDANASIISWSPVWSFTTSGTATTPPPPSGGSLPSPWVDQDVGSTGLAGSASYASGVFTVNGAGADIWGSADSFNFASQSLSGDGQIVARVTAEQNTNLYAKAGVMFRDSTSATAANVILDVRPDGSIEFMSRAANGGSTAFVAGSSHAFPVWLKLVRSGSTFTGSISSDGATWASIGSTSATIASTAAVGLAVTSHNTSAINSSTFDNVAVTASAGTPPPPPPSSSLPTPWANADIGSTGLAGSASYTSGTFTVKGAGADIWGTSDSFQYVYQPLSGSGQIVARVTAEQNTNTYAKAGVMFRGGLGSGDADVILDVRPDGSVEFMSRPSSGAATNYIAGSAQPFPAWLKLVNSSGTVTGYVSANGSTWTTVGTTSMSASAYVGLAVTSHNTAALNTSTFDNVTVTAGSTTQPPPPTTTPTNIVIYANDITSVNGMWSKVSDSTAAAGVKLATPDNGFAQTANALASPANFVDVTFNATAGTPYTFWMRLQALNNSKYNDSVWVQFSDAQVNGSTAYAIGTTNALAVNLATDSTGASDSGWGWVNSAYWLTQGTTVTFPTTGSHTVRVQVREDGVQFDQIVLSPTTYFNSSASCPNTCAGAPGPVSNDTTIVPK